MASSIHPWAVDVCLLSVQSAVCCSSSSSLGKHCRLFSLPDSTYFIEFWEEMKELGVYVGMFECEVEARKFFSCYQVMFLS